MLKSWGYGFSFDEDWPEMQVYGNACVDNCELKWIKATKKCPTSGIGLKICKSFNDNSYRACVNPGCLLISDFG